MTNIVAQPASGADIVTIASAIAAYTANRSTDNLRALHLATEAALGMEALAGPVETFPYISSFETGTDFSHFRARFDRELTATEVEKATACIRYAVRDWIGGKRLPIPTVVDNANGTVLDFEFHSVFDGNRDDPKPDTVEMFAHAEQFIREGTPVRPSNRAGIGTKGTRAHEGIGEVEVYFAIIPG